jgi:hypothetical protein
MGALCTAERVYGQESATYKRRTRDCVLILGRDNQAPLALRGTAIDIWDAFASPRPVADVASMLAAKYGAPLEDVQAEVQTVTDLLVAQRLLTTSGGARR